MKTYPHSAEIAAKANSKSRRETGEPQVTSDEQLSALEAQPSPKKGKSA